MAHNELNFNRVETPNGVAERALEKLWNTLTKECNVDSAKAKDIIKEEVDYLLNSK